MLSNEGREFVWNAFESGIFLVKSAQVKGVKMLTPQQMLEKLPVALEQVKANST